MNTSSLAIIALISPVLLAACGGGTSERPTRALDLPVFGGVGSGTPTIDQYLALADAINDLDGAISAGTVTSQIPQSATASYDGLSFATFATGTTAIGNITLNADFINDTIGGSSGEYLIIVDQSLGGGTVNASGTLPIKNGNITGTTFAADMNGTLTTGAGNYVITSNMLGAFADNSGQNLAFGTYSGNVVNPDASIDAISSGAFVATE